LGCLRTVNEYLYSGDWMVRAEELHRWPLFISYGGIDQDFCQYWLYSTKNIYSGSGQVFDRDYNKDNDGWMVMWI